MSTTQLQLVPSPEGENPALAGRFALRRARAPKAADSVSALSRGERVAYLALSALWVFVVARFWVFWLQPAHRGAPALYIPTTIALAYMSTVLPSFFWFYVGRMRRPVHVVPQPGLRVAVITLCVPSHESLDVIEGQLRALTAVEYPHDSWILDEGADPDVERLAHELGVRYFTRRGVEKWNQPMPPFQAKTKAGNVNAWLDHVAAIGPDYDRFVQVDIDHRPLPEYLDRTLGHFDDPKVAWVQAPSVCKNLESWTARGQAEQDLVLQGPLQMGFYGHSRTPFIIGSHTTYRTAAVREIGGFQPTRAEDHLDTVVLASKGYQGVYVPEIIASGDGPEDFSTYLAQQFAWAYSMVQILCSHTPRLVRTYHYRQAFQFLAAQSWYLMWSLSLVILWFLPLVALLTGRGIANIPLPQFLLYNLAMVATAGIMWCWCRPWFQPAGVRLSWRSFILETARWPIVLWAVINVVLRIKRPYMITPKGAGKISVGSGLRPYGPYFALVAIGSAGVFWFLAVHGQAPVQGYLVLVLVNILMVVVMLVVAIGLEVGSLGEGLGSLLKALRVRGPLMVALLAAYASLTAATAFAWVPILHSI